MITPRFFDPTRDGSGALLRPIPLDAFSGFLHLHAPKREPASAVRVLELGCGARTEPCFAAREGFDTIAAETTSEALERARERLSAEGFEAELRIVELSRLPFADASFDLAIDHGGLSGVGHERARRALRELARVLKPAGRLFFNPYSDRHSGARMGRLGADGTMFDVRTGSLAGTGPISFWSAEQVTAALVEDWRVLSRQHVEYEEQEFAPRTIHAEWRVVVEKVA